MQKILFSGYSKIPIQTVANLFLVAFLGMAKLLALNDFLTDTSQLIISTDDSHTENLDPEARDKVSHAKELIQSYSEDWQGKYGRLRRNLKINLVPVERQINVAGSRAEGIWAWSSFTNERGSLILGITGTLYVNINSSLVSQEALIAHEASHAFLLTYQPKLLETGTDFIMLNEGLAELFSVKYEPKPWRGWEKLLLAHRLSENLNPEELSIYGHRIYNVLTRKSQTPHDVGFFFLYVIRNGKVELDKDLKNCTNPFVLQQVNDWLKANPNDFDLPMIRE